MTISIKGNLNLNGSMMFTTPGAPPIPSGNRIYAVLGFTDPFTPYYSDDAGETWIAGDLSSPATGSSGFGGSPQEIASTQFGVGYPGALASDNQVWFADANAQNWLQLPDSGTPNYGYLDGNSPNLTGNNDNTWGMVGWDDGGDLNIRYFDTTGTDPAPPWNTKGIPWPGFANQFTESNFTKDVNGVLYALPTFYNPSVALSCSIDDGDTWQYTDFNWNVNQTAGDWSKLAAGDSSMMVVIYTNSSVNNTLWRSTDGFSFTNISLPANLISTGGGSPFPLAITYGNGSYVWLAEDTVSRVWVSEDEGLTFQEYSAGLGGDIFDSITFNDSYFMLSGRTTGDIYRSTDGKVWEAVTSIPGTFPGNPYLLSAQSSHGTFVPTIPVPRIFAIRGFSSPITPYYSDDHGDTWIAGDVNGVAGQAEKITSTRQGLGVAGSGGTANNFWFADVNAANWLQLPNSAGYGQNLSGGSLTLTGNEDNTWSMIAEDIGGGTYSYYDTSTSNPSPSWNQKGNPFTSTEDGYNVVDVNGVLYATPKTMSSGVIPSYSKDDGATWTQTAGSWTFGATDQATVLATDWAMLIFVSGASASASTLWRSFDGNTFSIRTTPALSGVAGSANTPTAIAFGNNVIVWAAENNIARVWVTNEDAGFWSSETTPEIFWSVIFNGTYFIGSTESSGKIFRSVDGEVWTEMTSLPATAAGEPYLLAANNNGGKFIPTPP